jgi:hypothetical protein
MIKRTIETSIDIDADTGVVWRLLMDFSAYPNWNPFIHSIEGKPKEGERLSVMIQPPGQSPMRFRPRVQSVQQQHAFSWLGYLLIPGLFDGSHEFRLEAIAHATRFHHRESFSGLLVPLVWNKMQQPDTRWFRSNESGDQETCRIGAESITEN